MNMPLLTVSSFTFGFEAQSPVRESRTSEEGEFRKCLSDLSMMAARREPEGNEGLGPISSYPTTCKHPL